MNKLKVDMIRTARRMSIRELSRASGVAKSHIQRIEAGEANPSIDVMFRLARALKCDISDLF